ncbi:ABC-2 type transport system ATP-binding protein [Azospirillum sp. OGB3]|uniref:ABC transporter ATP-binding protein n=1 Tax=Azospirillum sp. OGB3 TaxID=2587012 RepID=UPI001606126B|nr:ABC transporter ATP-binding protein [Azospirillum sp. OGB3]MBB3262607.1 ABC-2 type transport system ATP-binding protein [Azospirillum sp. OGB3]
MDQCAKQHAIRVETLTKRYGTARSGEVTAVDGISFTVAAGSVTGLLGGNGAGKTTTISMLLGLLLPTSGTVEVLGVDMVRHRHAALPRMNFSSPYVELPHRLTVRENLTVYGHLYGLKGVKRRVEELAEHLELTRFLERPSGGLSAGQKTRVALAKALLNRPELLLLDEPTASLDPDTADWIRTYLERYRLESGATILLASHNMLEVERMCDDVLMMRQGRIVDRGSPSGLLARYGRTSLEDVFLDIARDRANGEDASRDDRREAADAAE